MSYRIIKNRIGTHLRSTMLSGLILVGGTFGALADGQAYRVGANDVLQVTVYGQPSLTGLYPVDVDGNIGYPVVGNISVTGLTTNEISEKIAGSLSQHIPGLTVTATINQYAPVFVVGDVKAPGKYQFRPGMVVLELMALGGGAGKAESPALTAGMQLISAQQEYVDLQMQITAMAIRRARFEAELNGTDFTYTLPDQAAANKETVALTQKMLDGEKTVFNVRRNNLAAERRALEAQAASYGDEIQTLQQSIKLHDTEIGLLQENVDSSKSLVDRGLAAKSNLRDMERDLSATRRAALELASFLARARQNQLAMEQRIANLEEIRKSEAATNLQDIDLNIARMERRSNTQLQAMAEIAKSSGNISAATLRQKLVFSISRIVNGSFQDIVANESTEIKPGDILRVELDMSRVGGSPS
ncbi:polysaccharide biosynthesis/export family protein [Brucella anthropi]|uniref:Polysaccharide biosynthesis/export family protein n=2 Tax=Brucella TaxID=234 RepID=A0A6I0DJW2_BRUAN|nr:MULTISPECIES: polysaccharide biosynthesis/export family protein [Brucella/Ochrobactrum group]MCR5942116.1 sugar ABC transporter substrate-binding protein [Ochrobactrum sp. XJ1]QTN05187.1 sugar ABC transporter substrate-binding protein [Ochrobactrum sp. EEELCW01]KAB2740113.1 sugar ABC transporter substrate-binding protein [Brucella anthropi]KAB2755808.1 sugar ABC transporter substrate-binding protein [Brucella anthropi]KAB2767337.1 sugar ABC transporter substrate-binding protein [Brucella an